MAQKATKVLSRAGRLELGKRARDHLSRRKLGDLETKKRPFDLIEVLREAQKERVPRLLEVKYERMSLSAFAFFRGSVAVMAADLGHAAHSGLTVQLCGDAHVQNLGCFEAPDGRLVFDINDFDETTVGPWEWDVKRMAASIVLAGEAAEHTHSACGEAAAAFAATYVRMLTEMADQPILSAARHQIHRLKKVQAASAALRQAERAQPLDLLAKYAERNKRKHFRFRRVKDVLWPIRGKNKAAVLDSLHEYRQSLAPEPLHLFNFFEQEDVAFKIVGTGSVALRDYVVLLAGNGRADPLFLQIKQEMPSPYARYLKTPPPAHEGERVVMGQRRIQPTSDLLLGWTTVGAHHYLVRQLNDHKGSVDLANLKGQGLLELAGVAGELLARGHVRSGDPLAITKYIGGSDQAAEEIVRFSVKYAALASADYETFLKATKEGRLRPPKVSE